MFEWMLKYFEQRPMRERRGCKIIILKNFKKFLWESLHHYQKCPFKGQMSLAGFAQSSVPAELIMKYFLFKNNRIYFLKMSAKFCTANIKRHEFFTVITRQILKACILTHFLMNLLVSSNKVLAFSIYEID